MFITIDPYYDIKFYNECKDALRNNNVKFKEYISAKPPYNFYLEVDQPPTFINYDVVNPSYSKWLINLVVALRPNDDYIYRRRDSFTNEKALLHYGVNDMYRSAMLTGECVFFQGTKEQILRISKQYPRKIWYLGRYYSNKFRIFFGDKLIIKNFLGEGMVLAQGSKPIEVEIDLNFRVFRERDRLIKLSETPYILGGKYHDLNIRPELTGKFILSG